MLVHTALFLSGGVDQHIEVYDELGLSLLGLKSGKLWQCFSYATLHGSWYHLGVNLILLVTIGGKVQGLFGRRVTFTVLCSSILLGAIFHCVIEYFGRHAVGSLLIGISGGVMGLLIFLCFRMRDVRIFGGRLGLGYLAYGLLLSEAGLALMDPALGLPGFEQIGVGLSQLMGGSVFKIAHACHFGGGLAGWLWARYGAFSTWNEKAFGR
ncbi:rhomboid family intramembrane serine protease [Rubritalea tangerina]|uniref:rhomboid family intramembrane serine protease n=1 Tax=Rubritalea tangerina TaxID=430798 RepID=UPI003606E258